jgi:MgtC family
MAQGIMTGIGFLGAGVIFKQGFFSVAGLTTAASLWFTAALGIIYGLGFYYPAVLGTLAALFTLATLRWLEWRVTRQCFARLTLCFAKGSHHEPGQAGADFGRAGLCHSSGRLPANREWGDVRIQDGRQHICPQILSAVDVAVIALTWHEYRYLRSGLSSAGVRQEETGE